MLGFLKTLFCNREPRIRYGHVYVCLRIFVVHQFARRELRLWLCSTASTVLTAIPAAGPSMINTLSDGSLSKPGMAKPRSTKLPNYTNHKPNL